MDEEDWNKPTVLRKGRVTTKDARKTATVNRAMATDNVEVHRKSAGGNKQHAAPSVNLAKIEGETEEFKVLTIDKTVAKAIIDGRQKKGVTQKELATLINEKVQVIQEYEGGKALPNQAILGKLERALGIKLRGHDIGSVLEQSTKSRKA